MIRLLSFQLVSLFTPTSQSARHIICASVPLFMQFPLSSLVWNITTLPRLTPQYTQYLISRIQFSRFSLSTISSKKPSPYPQVGLNILFLKHPMHSLSNLSICCIIMKVSVSIGPSYSYRL